MRQVSNSDFRYLLKECQKTEKKYDSCGELTQRKYLEGKLAGLHMAISVMYTVETKEEIC